MRRLAAACCRPRLMVSLVVCVSVLALGGTAAAGLVVNNGDFETGGLSGWTASASSGTIPPLSMTPLIGVTMAGENKFARFNTGTFAAGPFISTLRQAVELPASAGTLSLDFSYLTGRDSTGSGASSFLDSFSISIDDGLSSMVLLLVDKDGVAVDPFGVAPGAVKLISPSDSFFQQGFSTDISSLSGKTVNLFFDIANEDDGFAATAFVDNVRLSTTAVPEPSSLCLALAGMGLLLVTRFLAKPVSGAGRLKLRTGA